MKKVIKNTIQNCVACAAFCIVLLCILTACASVAQPQLAEDTLSEALTQALEAQATPTPVLASPSPTQEPIAAAAQDEAQTQDEEAAQEAVLIAYHMPQVEVPSMEGENTVVYFAQMILYMMVNDLASYSCTFTGISGQALEAADLYGISSLAFVQVQNEYHELGAFYAYIQQEMRTDANGNTTLTLWIGDYDYANEEIAANKAAFLAEIDALANEMYQQGAIAWDDSDYDKAAYFYAWCAYNLQYDTTYQPESFTGYGALYEGTAICQGYVSVFNALCNASGIPAIGVSGTVDGGKHIWSYVQLDDVWVYVDPAFGDPVPDMPGVCAWDYFALSKEEIETTHVFDVFE